MKCGPIFLSQAETSRNDNFCLQTYVISLARWDYAFPAAKHAGCYFTLRAFQQSEKAVMCGIRPTHLDCVCQQNHTWTVSWLQHLHNYIFLSLSQNCGSAVLPIKLSAFHQEWLYTTQVRGCCFWASTVPAVAVINTNHSIIRITGAIVRSTYLFPVHLTHQNNHIQ